MIRTFESLKLKLFSDNSDESVSTSFFHEAFVVSQCLRKQNGRYCQFCPWA